MMIALAMFLVFANGFFVAAEFALVKVRSTQLDVLVAEGDRRARLARPMLDDLPRYLAVSQLGITLASLALGWIGEPAIERLLHPMFEAVNIGQPVAGWLSFGLGFTLISAMHIVLGEVAPKNLAIARTEAVVLAVAAPIRLLYIAAWPALVLLNGSANVVLRALGIEPADEHNLSVHSDELQQIAADSAEAGHITKGEGQLLENVFRFSDRVAREIMVPRDKVRGIDLKRPMEDVVKDALENGHSRYPVFEKDLEGVIGVLHMKDLMARIGSGKPIGALKDLVRPAMFVPETMSAKRLLGMFQRQRSHLAIVLDEYGGVTGVVTLEDTIEELVGEIQDEHDDERQPVETIDGGFSVEGRILLSELGPLIDTSIDSDSTTLSGYVMEQLGRTASVGDAAEIGEHWRARVVQVDRRSIERVEVTRRAAPTLAPTGK